MNRKFLIATIFLSAIFIAILGMRNPYLNQNHGPKQRPRAVVETNSPSPQQICKNQSLDAAVCEPITLITPTVRLSSHRESTHELPFIAIPRFAARAPPCELS